MLQFMHDHYYKNSPEFYLEKDVRRTFVFELPDYNVVETEVIKAITDLYYVPMVSFRVGVAKCHKDDNYVKSIGREKAVEKMVMVDFAISKVYSFPEDNETIVTLYNMEMNLHLRVALRKESRNVRVLAAD